jgi:hypothetical protein
MGWALAAIIAGGQVKLSNKNLNIFFADFGLTIGCSCAKIPHRNLTHEFRRAAPAETVWPVGRGAVAIRVTHARLFFEGTAPNGQADFRYGI